MKRILMVRRKGFNYYTDYTELYLHRAFQNFGYSIVRERSKCDFCVTVWMSETEKYMRMTSSFFDEMDEGDVEKLCDIFSDAFKSEVKMDEIGEYEGKAIEYRFGLSKTYSAYDEPVYLVDEPPMLKQRVGIFEFRTNKENTMSFVNVGGKFSGISITLEFIGSIDDLDLSDARISCPDDEELIRRHELVFEKENNSFRANLDYFKMDKGVNPKSAVLRGKKRFDEEGKYEFWLDFMPVSKEDAVLKGTLTIESDGVELFKCDI